MFENVLMLAGLGGAVIPLVIHLLGRARYRNVEWGAMMFLDAGSPAYRDGGRLREWALLGVRMAAVALLAVALARPTLAPLVAPANTSPAAAAAEPRVAAAVIIDCSASMAQEDVGGSRLDAARAAALQVFSTLKRGDRACLLVAGAGQLPASLQFTSDIQSLASHIGELKPADGYADLPAAIDLAAAALARQERASRQLYVICDRQAASWRGAGAGGSTDRVGALARFVVVPVGGREADNVAVESVAVVNPPAVAGAPTDVEVRVRNYSAAGRQGLPLDVRAAGRQSATTTLNLPANGTATATVPVTFPAAGSQVLVARLREGGPSIDDTATRIVEVSPPLRVLLIRGGGGSRETISAALAPFHSAGADGPDLAAVTELPAEKWDAATDLAKYQAIVLDDLPNVSRDQSASLEQFVYAGGGLLVAPGPAARIDEYNRTLYREEGGLLPALLQPPAAPPQPTTIDTSTLDTAHPMLHFLAGHGSPLSAIVERFIPTTARTPAAHVLGSFATGDPFLIDAPFGRGHVVLVTCSLRSQWSTLPLTSLYLPLVQSAARYLASSNVPDRNVALGEELVATFVPPVEGSRATVSRPSGPVEQVDVARLEDRSEVRYGKTDVPGVYRISAGPRGKERTAAFAVAASPAESDPTPLTDAQWRDLAARYGFALMEPDDRPLAARLTPGVVAGGEWIVVLSAVLALLVLEMGLTRLWSAERASAVTAGAEGAPA